MANEILSENALAAIGTMVGRAIKGLGSTGSLSVTYKRQTAEAYDPTAANANSPTTDDEALTVTVITTRSEGEPNVSGMLKFLITVADFETAYASGVTPSEGDQVTHDSATYEVSGWAADPLLQFFSVSCKRVG